MANQVNGNAVQLKEEEEPMDTSSVTHTEHYKTLIEAGLPQKVAERLDEIFQTGLVAYVDLDERAIDALREFNEEGALSVLQQFKESDLSHVQNKSAFLCGVMKTYRQREKQGSKVQESTKGPDEAKIKALLERTGYTLDVTTGQRKYGGPPPDSVYSGMQPGIGTEVKVLFVRNLATTVTEEILEKSFSEFGKLERVKKLKDYAFVHFEDRGAAVKAMDEMNGKEIEGEEIEIVLAKPPDKKRKERQAARQASRSTAYEDYYYHPPPRMPPPIRGRGRGGGRGGYGYPPDYYGYEDYYDDYYGYDYHDYRGGYEDPYYGYDDGYAVRGRGGGRGGRGAPPPPRGRGAPPPRGRAGYSQRGAPLGPPRGSRGGRGGPAQQQRGRGSRGSRGNRGGNVGGKRKADGYNQPDSKRRQTNNQQNWGSQPIAQQPLQQGGDYSGNYGYNNDNQEFYQDTYGQQWK
ncbi:heterogeneous nuclear ribonucleoprotein R isoform X7 [Phocoena sinus]|uniref:heterogeneous nuclear ribonucleoprotein R isoform X7 n=1 Tax=Phocoena sinus TaxID=42100 RepID=UPI0013C53970|nr:heterogeneous nuclear ribonucleoprotein R isoform X7 [Phocoena sinus]